MNESSPAGRRALADGREIPLLGFGTYQLRPGSATQRAVETALEAGYRHIDTATAYGNESDVGAAVRASGLGRDDVWITTKLWNSDHADPEAALRRSLDLLGFDQVDLWLMHWPTEVRLATWQTMVNLQDEGLTRSIGVSNFLTHHLTELLAVTEVAPVIDQIEMSPFLYRTRADTLATAESAGVVIEAYSPLTKGARLDNAVVAAIAGRTAHTPAQVLLRWCVQHGFVTLPRSSNPQRIAENARIFDFELTEADLAELDGLDEGFTTGWDPATQA